MFAWERNENRGEESGQKEEEKKTEHFLSLVSRVCVANFSSHSQY